jgi:hypothetical protein
MGSTHSLSTRLHLRDSVDNFATGRVCLDEFTEQAKYEVRQLESILLGSADFLLGLDAAQCYLPAVGRPIYTSTIVHEHTQRITLLGIPENQGIPLHDHPNMISIVAFLSGRIHSPIYRVSPKNRGSNLAELINYSERTYSRGDITLLTPDTGNLHSMRALSAMSVCLSIQLSMQPRFSKQSFYFPAVAESVGRETSLWHRIPFRGGLEGA